jgi:hypothetical protein
VFNVREQHLLCSIVNLFIHVSVMLSFNFKLSIHICISIPTQSFVGLGRFFLFPQPRVVEHQFGGMNASVKEVAAAIFAAQGAHFLCERVPAKCERSKPHGVNVRRNYFH